MRSHTLKRAPRWSDCQQELKGQQLQQSKSIREGGGGSLKGNGQCPVPTSLSVSGTAFSHAGACSGQDHLLPEDGHQRFLLGPPVEGPHRPCHPKVPLHTRLECLQIQAQTSMTCLFSQQRHWTPIKTEGCRLIQGPVGLIITWLPSRTQKGISPFPL